MSEHKGARTDSGQFAKAKRPYSTLDKEQCRAAVETINNGIKKHRDNGTSLPFHTLVDRDQISSMLLISLFKEDTETELLLKTKFGIELNGKRKAEATRITLLHPRESGVLYSFLEPEDLIVTTAWDRVTSGLKSSTLAEEGEVSSEVAADDDGSERIPILFSWGKSRFSKFLEASWTRGEELTDVVHEQQRRLNAFEAEVESLGKVAEVMAELKRDRGASMTRSHSTIPVLCL
jgi:hypothetical protein